MRTYTIRKWNPDSESIFFVELTPEEMVKNPTHLNLLDVGIALLMEGRREKGLSELSPEMLNHKGFENYGPESKVV